MKAATIGIITALGLVTGMEGARAEYRCDSPPTRVDRVACEAAAESPEALRRYVQRMQWLHNNLYFYDYVNRATIQAWDEMHANTAKRLKEAATTAPATQGTETPAVSSSLAEPH
jgi:hypothetical protein